MNHEGDNIIPFPERYEVDLAGEVIDLAALSYEQLRGVEQAVRNALELAKFDYETVTGYIDMRFPHGEEGDDS